MDAKLSESILHGVAALLAEVTGEDAAWADRISHDTRLEDDLWLDSIEMTALGERMRDRYGERVDLPAYLADQDLDGLIALTVGDLVALAAPAPPATEASPKEQP